MLFAVRDEGDTSGVGAVDMTEAERRIADVVKYGKVTQVDYSDTSNPKVRIGIGDSADEDGYIETDWLPMGASRSNEWDPLQVGEQVIVHAEGGELQNGMVGRAIHSSDNPAPSDRPDLYLKKFPNGGMLQYDYASGELKLVAEKLFTVTAGNAMISAKDGHLVLSVGGVSLEITPSGFAFTGAKVTSDNTITGQAVKTAAGVGLDTHKHTGVQTGPGISGVPAP